MHYETSHRRYIKGLLQGKGDTKNYYYRGKGTHKKGLLQGKGDTKKGLLLQGKGDT